MPLRPGIWGHSPNDCLEEIWSVEVGSHSAPVYDFTCRKAGDFALWGQSFSNEGPFTITVLQIGEPSSFAPLKPLEVRTYPFSRHVSNGDAEIDLPDVSRFYTDLEPFEAFTLAPGELQNIVFRWELNRDCSREGGRIGFTAIPIRYRVLGIERTEWWVPFQLALRCSPSF